MKPRATIWLALLAATACGPEAPRPNLPPPAPAMPSSAPLPPKPPPLAKSKPAPPVAPKSRAGVGAIGNAGPIVVERVAADGGWVSFCQAREDTDGDGKISVSVGVGGRLEGDRMTRFFAMGSGDGEPIQALAASDASGRWVVLQKEGHFELLDTETKRTTDLDALGLDARDDALPFRGHRALSFDGAGTTLLYLRRDASHTLGVLRSLADGSEIALDPGPGEVWRAELDFAGHFAIFDSLVDDTNHDGRLTWPAPIAKTPPPCRGPVTTYSAWVGRGDQPVQKLASREKPAAESVLGFVTTLGSGWVVRDPDGRLFLRSGKTSTELAPAKCGAKVLHADAERRLLLIACTKKKGRPELELVGPGFSRDLGVDIASASSDRRAGAPTRLVAVYPGNDSALLDFEKKALVPLQPGDAVIATYGSRALVHRDKRLVLVDVDGETTELEGETDPLADTLSNGAIGICAPLVVDLASGKQLGSVSGRPLGLAPDGRALVATGGDADADHLASGPLEWKSPETAPATQAAVKAAADTGHPRRPACTTESSRSRRSLGSS